MKKIDGIWLKVIKFTFFLIILSLILFALIGDFSETFFNQQSCQQLFTEMKPFAWLIATALLTLDLLLPLPATAIIAALGAVYGTLLGGFSATLAILASGVCGYWLANKLINKYPALLGTKEEIDKFSESFDKWGPLLIILSRFTPILPEVTVILAGAGKMNFKRFFTALSLSAFSTAFAFALLGDLLSSRPFILMVISLSIPVFLWLVIKPFLKNKKNQEKQ